MRYAMRLVPLVTILVAALTVGMTTALAPTAPALADCGMQAPPRLISGYRGLAFIGTVARTERVDAVGYGQVSAITYRIERMLAGRRVTSMTVVEGNGGSCWYVDGRRLRVGDRVLISAAAPVDRGGSHPFLSHELVWRSTGHDTWRFASGMYGIFLDSYPPAARAATTTRAIRAIVAPDGDLSDASTSPVPDPSPAVTCGEAGHWDPPQPMVGCAAAIVAAARVLPPDALAPRAIAFEYGQPCPDGVSCPLPLPVHGYVMFDLGPGPDVVVRVTLDPATGLVTADAPEPWPSPGAATDPRTVLERYLAALLTGDCEAATAETATTFRYGSGELCGHLTVTAVSIEPGGPATPSDDEVVLSTRITTVGGDASIPDGTMTWFYQLLRQPDGRWLIAGGGSGP